MGPYYQIGRAIAAAVSGSSEISATAEVGNSQAANIGLILEGEAEIAFLRSDVAAWAYDGEAMFDGTPLRSLRVIAALYSEALQLVVSKAAGIDSVAGLRGKRVGVGAAGSSAESGARAVLRAAGLEYGDMSVEFIEFAEIISRFEDGSIDAGFAVAGVPTAALARLAEAGKGITLIGFDDELMDKITEANPFFSERVIPAGTYGGIGTDILTPGVMTLLVTDGGVAEEVIYGFTKALFENVAEVRASHAMARSIALLSAPKGFTVPLHPGAAKYYEEAGLEAD
jgi:TRAP transporter TAXI family solute receptor